MNIFDCTLRELGYQTNWNFDDNFCKNLYNFATKQFINYLELGFLTHPEFDKIHLGKLRYCNNYYIFINKIFKDIKTKNVKISAMIDLQKKPLVNLIEKKDTVIDTIRILTRSNNTNFEELETLVKVIKNKNYEVFINFTLAGNNSLDLNKQFAKFAKINNIKCIYFADTESTMTEKYVENTIKICHDLGIKVGIHLHNKNGTAENLNEIALKNKVDFIDITLSGFGGKNKDGNLSTEYYLYINKLNGGLELTNLKNEMISQLIKYRM